MNIWPRQNRLQRDRRRAFTLAELLVVIAIIGLVASMTLFGLQGAREDARERRARAQVTKIHELIMRQWESYRTRPVPVSNLDKNPRTAAEDRLEALRSLMRMELPDRYSDLTGRWTTKLATVPRLLEAYNRRLSSNHSPKHEEAECLYLILATMRDGNTTGLDFFSEDEIGDKDGDGMPEILDPWGVPIRFLRWAPGFRSDIQPGAGDSGDLFDPLKVDPDSFALYPLIVSAGRDGEFYEPGWAFDSDPRTDSDYDDPYCAARTHLGKAAPKSDNITNHSLQVR